MVESSKQGEKPLHKTEVYTGCNQAGNIFLCSFTTLKTSISKFECLWKHF